MKLNAVTAVLTLLVPFFGTDLAGEERSERHLRAVSVKLERSAQQIKARLVRVSAESVTLLIKDREVTFPSDQVERITARRWDSVLDGALLGAAGGGLVCALVCGQGLERRDELPAVIGRSAVTVGVIGAALDAMTFEADVLYWKPVPSVRTIKVDR